MALLDPKYKSPVAAGGREVSLLGQDSNRKWMAVPLSRDEERVSEMSIWAARKRLMFLYVLKVDFST